MLVGSVVPSVPDLFVPLILPPVHGVQVGARSIGLITMRGRIS